MIICFEGPSAIGKTKLSQLFSESHLIIPEVNLLFKKESTASKFWYYERQVERYDMGLGSDKDAILDGDIFQPLWYNWIYGYPPEFPSFEETTNFYLEQISSNNIHFPDLYIVFQANVEVLRKRKRKDATRQRRNFEKHLQMIESQKKYFTFLKEQTDIAVEFVDYLDLETTQKKVLHLLDAGRNPALDTAHNFKTIVDCLDRTDSSNP